jgi:glycosyltransferase involved in cell wall biosynthesis
MEPSHITALILARDEEASLPRALRSLPPGISILVVDTGSRDRTVEIARSSGARVVEVPWTDFVTVRRTALRLVETPWTLVVDSDEELDAELRDAILRADGAETNGYLVRRDTYFRGRALRMWRGERLLRLVRTSCARVEAHAVAGAAPLHERLVCDGRPHELSGRLLHHSYADRAAYRAKFERYTAIEASAARADAFRLTVEAALVPLRFAAHLTIRGALLDGPDGWFVAWHSALYPAVVAWKSRV